MMHTARRHLAAALRTPTGLVSAITIAVLVALAILGPVLFDTRAGAVHVADLLQGSSAAHPLGTDDLGRDLLARVLVATRLSLELAVLAIAVAAGIGVPLGALPAILGRRAGRVVATFIEFSIAFPGLLLAIFLGVVIGVGAKAAVLAIGIASAPGFARLTQTLAASASGSDYVAAARTLGVGRWRILFRHVLPNIAEPIILNVTLGIGYALLAMSGLSFIGLGVQPPRYDWGRLLNDALNRIYVAPAAALGAAAAIVLAGLAFNGLGEALAAAAGARVTIRHRRVERPAEAVPAAELAAAGADPHVVRVNGHHRPDPPTTGADAVAPTLLRTRGLTVTFPSQSGGVSPVCGVDLEIAPGERVGVVGESGSGKSLTALAIAQLVPHPATLTADRLEIDGRDIRTLPRRARSRMLGRALAMVFQDPATSLNPAMRVRGQLAEVGVVHAGLSKDAAETRAVDRLRAVRMSSPARRARQFPHELSGGMRQRAMIAMGLMVTPKLIIADEPTSALDVTVQREILALLRQVNRDTGAALLLITHDLAVVSALCGRALVMYAGRIVEDLDVTQLRAGPAHPYTRALLATIPDMATDRHAPLATIPGAPPDPAQVGSGCPFAPRCAHASTRCRTSDPQLVELRHCGPRPWRVACWHPQQTADVAPAEAVRS
jgi:oligopeptide/dipeptide ABC transporter ATP-binding protein